MGADTQTFQETTMDITIYHNPRCSKSRQTLELLREAGHEPLVVEYLKTPPTPRQLQALVRRLGVQVRDLIRTNEPPYQELGLDAQDVPDQDLIKAIAEHPILLNRPIVVTPHGARICRPPELVNELLDSTSP